MTTININTLTIAQLESTPLEGFYIQPMSCKEGECIFPYTYINLYNTHLSSDYILNNLKQLLPQQRWYKKFLFGAWVVQNYK